VIVNEGCRLSPVLMIVGAAAVAFVVALLAMGVGSSDSKDTVAAAPTTADSAKGGECGDGQPDPTYTLNLTPDPARPGPRGRRSISPFATTAVR
jgi:hypothetical protein